MPGSKTIGLALIAGIVHATSFAPDPLPAWVLAWVQLLAMAVLVHLVWRATCMRHAALLGLAFGVGNFSTGLYWLHISIHQYGGVAWLPATLAVLLLAAFEALYIACAGALAWRLTPQSPVHGMQAALAWVSSWVLFEWLRGTLFTGFPWLNVAYAHSDSVFAAWASVTGAYGVAWFAAFTAASLALLVRTQAGWTHRLSAVFLVGSIAIAGMLLDNNIWITPHGQVMTVRLVQGNVSPTEKYAPQRLRPQLDMHHDLAARPSKDGGTPPQLIVLPETVIPVLQHRLAADAWQRWMDLARTQQSTVLLGAPVRSGHGGTPVDTNSVLIIDGASDLQALMQGTSPRYDKSHLVPFGEFIPPGFRWFVNAMAIPLGNFARGAPRQALLPVAGQAIAPNICYEDVFGEEILQAVRPSTEHGDQGATLLVNFSDLAWFGNSWALRQHLQMARMRSLETGRPLLRATNTGMTTAISPQGVVYAQLSAQHVGVLDVTVQGMQGLTPYVRMGNTPLLLWLAATLVWLLWRTRQTRAPA